MGGFLTFAGTLALAAFFLRVATGNGEVVSGWFFSQIWRVFDIRLGKPKQKLVVIESPQREEVKLQIVQPAVLQPPRVNERPVVEHKPDEAPLIVAGALEPRPTEKPEKKEDAKQEISAAKYLKAITLLGVLADCGKNEARKTWASRNLTATGPGGSPEMVKGLAEAFETICEFRKWKDRGEGHGRDG